jgi:uncharacterized YccA/Bax inhibitor family protein
LPGLLQLLPPGVLAGMLMFVAIQHGLLAARLEGAADRAIAATVGVVTLAAGNLAWGFLAGVVLVLVRAGWPRRRAALGELQPAERVA